MNPSTSSSRSQLVWVGLAVFVLQLPSRFRRTFARTKELRYGRRLKGPFWSAEASSPRPLPAMESASRRTIQGARCAFRAMRENKHFLIVGDTGSGKSTIIRQMLYQVDARGDSAIVYDPACEFVKQFYDAHRGDIVLNPLDARMPYWNPSKELRRKAEAKALAVSLYQPEGVTNRFFVESPQKIFAHLLTYLPTPDGAGRVDVRPGRDRPPRQGNRYWALIDPKAPQQRTGVLGSLNMSADSFRLAPQGRGNNVGLDRDAVGREPPRLDLHYVASDHARGTAPAHQLVDRYAGACGFSMSPCLTNIRSGS